MTKEREQIERETMEIVRGWTGEHDAYLRTAALSYAKGLHDGAQIMASHRGENLPCMVPQHTAV